MISGWRQTNDCFFNVVFFVHMKNK